MADTVLILTHPEDIHAFAVALALRERGVGVLLWHTSDFPSRAAETICVEAGVTSTRLTGIGDSDLSSYGISRVWRRRPLHVLPKDRLHPADRQFAEAECTIFRQSLLATLLPQAFWINPHDAGIRAGRKILQHRAALEVGLTVPDSLYSNDPAEIRDFIRRHGGEVIYKPFRACSWSDSETSWMPYTALVTEKLLVADDLLRLTPGIFQVRIPKAYELRVTVIGRKAFSAKIHSQETTKGRLDWRKSYNELRMEPYELPAEVAAGCLRLMDALGLVFGCFDFIVTPHQRYVFLEINEMGQFLFIEHWTGLPLLDAFSELLTQGQADFSWDAGRVRSRYSGDLQAEALALLQQAKTAHEPLPVDVVDEESSEEEDSRSGPTASPTGRPSPRSTSRSSI